MEIIMDDKWIISQLKGFLGRYEDSQDKHSLYENSADETRRFVEDMSPLVTGRLFINRERDRGLAENMKSEAGHILNSFGLSFIINYLHSLATGYRVTISEEIEKKVKDMNEQQGKIYCELVSARALQQFKSEDNS